jgi:hypothetical protein
MYILHHVNAVVHVCRGGLCVVDGSILWLPDVLVRKVMMRYGGIGRHNAAVQLQTCNISLYRDKRVPNRGFP